MENNIKIITAHSQDIIKNKEIYAKLIRKGIFVFAYTSNNSEFINNNMDKFFTNIYTDFWDFNNNSCISVICDTY